MKLLALETATEACSAAIWCDGMVWERYELAPRRHAAVLLPMVEAALMESGLTIQQLDALAVGRGPGAFTGVRVALSVAQGLAFAVDKPVIPVSTLAALALGVARATGASRIATALDARMGEVYWGTWVVSGATVEPIGAERVCAPALVNGGPGPWLGVGSGWVSYAAVLSQRLAVSEWLGDYYPRAGDVARLAAAACRETWVTAEQAVPVYLRERVAVRRE